MNNVLKESIIGISRLNTARLLLQFLSEGQNIEVLVEGEDEISENIAKRLFSGITSMEERKMDFERF